MTLPILSVKPFLVKSKQKTTIAESKAFGNKKCGKPFISRNEGSANKVSLEFRTFLKRKVLASDSSLCELWGQRPIKSAGGEPRRLPFGHWQTHLLSFSEIAL